MIAALAEGAQRVAPFRRRRRLHHSTLDFMKALGAEVKINKDKPSQHRHGVRRTEGRAPRSDPATRNHHDALVAGIPRSESQTQLTGDASLQKRRPMTPSSPSTRMGADIRAQRR